MKRWMLIGICMSAVVLVGIRFVEAEELRNPKVAVVYSSFLKNKGRDFSLDADRALTALGWECDKYENVHIKELMNRITDYDIVILTQFADQENTQDFGNYASQWKNFLEKGGILYINNVYDGYSRQARWLGSCVDASLYFTVGRRGSGEEEKIIPHVNQAEKLMMEPNEILLGEISGRYMTKWAEKWRMLAGYSETEAVVLYQDYGKGLVLVSVYPLPDENLLENIWFYKMGKGTSMIESKETQIYAMTSSGRKFMPYDYKNYPHQQLIGTKDPDAIDGEARTSEKDTCYTWWNLDDLKPGVYDYYIRAKSGDGESKRFSLVVQDRNRSAYKIRVKEVEPVFSNTEYRIIHVGTFYYDGSYPLRLTDWSSGGAWIDYVFIVQREATPDEIKELCRVPWYFPSFPKVKVDYSYLRNVGSKKQLFIDNKLIEKSENVTLKINPPQKTGDKCIVPTKEWEEWMIGGYISVMEDNGRYRMWYEAYDLTTKGDDRDITRLCYAESNDGIHWEKPTLGIVKYKGSKENNIVYPNINFKFHGATVFKDPVGKPNERYKMVFWGKEGIYGAVSPDGLHWKTISEPIVNKKTSDTQNVCFWDERIKKYVIFCRFWSPQRMVGRTESKNFRKFPMPRVVLSYDKQDGPNVDIYNSAAIKYPYASNVYFMFPSIFHHSSDRLDVQLATSRDGINWCRPDRTPFIPNGKKGEFDSGCIYMGVGCIRKGNEIWMYYAGYNRGHTLEGKSIKKMGQISRVVLPLDRYISVYASGEDGTVITYPLVFTGNHLELNIQGSVRVGLLDENGKPFPQFSLDNCDPINGNYIAKTVTWNGKSDISSLIGKKVKILFKMKSGTKLYAFQFVK